MHQEINTVLYFVIWKNTNKLDYISGTFQEVCSQCEQKFGPHQFVLDGCGFTRADGYHVIRLGYCEEYLKRYNRR